LKGSLLVAPYSSEKKMVVTISIIRCKSKSLWNSRTLFTFINKKYKELEKLMIMSNTLLEFIDNHSLSISLYRDYIDAQSQFLLELNIFKKVTTKKISVKNRQDGYLKIINIWIDIHKISPLSNKLVILFIHKFITNGLDFSFMFQRLIRVI